MCVLVRYRVPVDPCISPKNGSFAGPARREVPLRHSGTRVEPVTCEVQARRLRYRGDFREIVGRYRGPKQRSKVLPAWQVQFVVVVVVRSSALQQ